MSPGARPSIRITFTLALTRLTRAKLIAPGMTYQVDDRLRGTGIAWHLRAFAREIGLQRPDRLLSHARARERDRQ